MIYDKSILLFLLLPSAPGRPRKYRGKNDASNRLTNFDPHARVPAARSHVLAYRCSRNSNIYISVSGHRGASDKIALEKYTVVFSAVIFASKFPNLSKRREQIANDRSKSNSWSDLSFFFSSEPRGSGHRVEGAACRLETRPPDWFLDHF